MSWSRREPSWGWRDRLPLPEWSRLEAPTDSCSLLLTFVSPPQISPFPYDLVTAELARFPRAEVVWVQEEPKNMGAWTYVQPRLGTASQNTRTARSLHGWACHM